MIGIFVTDCSLILYHKITFRGPQVLQSISSCYFLVSSQSLQHNKPKHSSQTPTSSQGSFPLLYPVNHWVEGLVQLRCMVPAWLGPQQQVPHHYLISLTLQHNSLVLVKNYTDAISFLESRLLIAVNGNYTTEMLTNILLATSFKDKVPKITISIM